MDLGLDINRGGRGVQKGQKIDEGIYVNGP